MCTVAVDCGISSQAIIFNINALAGRYPHVTDEWELNCVPIWISKPKLDLDLATARHDWLFSSRLVPNAASAIAKRCCNAPHPRIVAAHSFLPVHRTSIRSSWNSTSKPFDYGISCSAGTRRSSCPCVPSLHIWVSGDRNKPFNSLQLKFIELIHDWE